MVVSLSHKKADTHINVNVEFGEGDGKSINYIQNRRQFLETYLEDGRCSFSNNLSENAIRPFTVGRKNWLFSDTVDGDNASATVYSIVEIAKVHNLNIYKYLVYLLEHCPVYTQLCLVGIMRIHTIKME